MRIDAHHHYWNIERNDYGWITPDLPVLYRSFGPEDLDALLRKHRLDGTIVVQAAPTLEETEFLLDLAQNNESVLGVVGWLDLFHPEHRKVYQRFRNYPKFVGFRIMIQDMPDASRILEPGFVKALQGYASEEVPVDLLMFSGQLETVLELLRQVPDLRGVIDHIGKPDICKGEATESWVHTMKKIAQFPGIYCKLSGMVTEADHEHWKSEDFVPYIRKVLTWFGPRRVMFGSDWPVCLLAADYDQVMDVLINALPPSWGDYERSRLFGENAKEFYKL